MSQKTWGGRFSGETDNRVEAFTESISFDRRLYRHDVIASKAHARMLAEDVVVYGDSGGTPPSWPRPIVGRDNVSRLLLGLAGQMRQVGITISPAEINGQPGAMFLDPAGRLTNVFVLDIADGQVQRVRSVINPAKLRHLGPLADMADLRRQLHSR